MYKIFEYKLITDMILNKNCAHGKLYWCIESQFKIKIFFLPSSGTINSPSSFTWIGSPTKYIFPFILYYIKYIGPWAQ